MRLRWFYLCARCLSSDRFFCDHRTRRLGPCHRRALPIAEVRRRPLFPSAFCIRLCFGRRRGSILARSSLGGSLDLPTDVRIQSFLRCFQRSRGWPHGCFGWQQGVSAVPDGSCALDHRSDHYQTAAATGPERHRKVVGVLAAFSHVISPTTPRVVAGPPGRAVCDPSQMKTMGCALSGLWCGLEPFRESQFDVRDRCHAGGHACSGAVHVVEGAYAPHSSPCPSRLFCAAQGALGYSLSRHRVRFCARCAERAGDSRPYSSWVLRCACDMPCHDLRTAW